MAWLPALLIHPWFVSHSCAASDYREIFISFVYILQIQKIINYLPAMNVLQRHFGHSVTFQEVFTIKLVTRGLRRILGDARKQISQSLKTYCFLAVILIGFYTFFRK